MSLKFLMDKKLHPALHEYICKQLLARDEDGIDQYLNQFCYLSATNLAVADMLVKACHVRSDIAPRPTPPRTYLPRHPDPN